jgi:hypothetical protein
MFYPLYYNDGSAKGQVIDRTIDKRISPKVNPNQRATDRRQGPEYFRSATDRYVYDIGSLKHGDVFSVFARIIVVIGMKPITSVYPHLPFTSPVE